jgi:hypothetical protein
MKYKHFTAKLHQQLDEIGLPEREDERIDAFAKLFHQPRFKAASILSGQMIPDQELLEKLANEFEVSVNWLLDQE